MTQPTETERLREAILIRIGSNFGVTTYSFQELSDYFCASRDKNSGRKVYAIECLVTAISQLLEEGVLIDFGGGWYSRPPPKKQGRDENTAPL